jgi:hypothetical protein
MLKRGADCYIINIYFCHLNMKELDKKEMNSSGKYAVISRKSTKLRITKSLVL